MGRWTTQIGDDAMVISTTSDGRISIGTVSGRPIIADSEDAEDIRVKLFAAIVTARGTDQSSPTI